MKLASKEEIDVILKETREWAFGHEMFKSAVNVTALAIAEFMMNRDGKTMYHHDSSFNGK